MEELKLEIREIPIGELVENTGQIPDVPATIRQTAKESAGSTNRILDVMRICSEWYAMSGRVERVAI
jgi:hypothetical protein